MGNKIPKISPDRVDQSPVNTAVGSTQNDKAAHAFIKGREPTKSIAIRFPVSIHKALKEVAFNNNESINKLVLKVLKKYLKKHSDIVL
jgi:predicted HicB family RNase H-like nuclease